MYEISPTRPFLTPSFILSKLSEEEIFERYLMPVTDKKVCNPMRKDNNPTCSFFRGKSGRIIFTDYSGAFFGDCFKVVQSQYNLGFYEALEKIAIDFGILTGETIQKLYSSTVTVKSKELKPAVIEVKRQSWTEVDKKYWKSFGLNSKILSKYNVASCEFVWLDGRIIYSYHPKDPAYVYWFGEGNYKIYFPFRDNYRFLGNTTKMQGFDQLPETGEICVVTKSLKDVMVLDIFNIPAFAPQSESIVLSDELACSLKKRFTNIYTLYDFSKEDGTVDRPACRSAFRMWRELGIPMLFLTNGRYGTKDYQAKDISDFIKKFGYDATKELITETYNIII
jgi:hypothetical protein